MARFWFEWKLGVVELLICCCRCCCKEDKSCGTELLLIEEIGEELLVLEMSRELEVGEERKQTGEENNLVVWSVLVSGRKM